MAKDSSSSRDSGRDLRHSLPLRRKNFSPSKERQHKPEKSRGKEVILPEIRISEPTDDSDDDDEKVFISIGIDLGTTYSGVAWALSTDPHVIQIVSSWESDLSNNRDNHKVPSVLTYDKKSGNVTSWGYKLEHRKHHISWFKLALSTHAAEMVAKDQPERIKKLDRLLSDYDKEPVEVAADYLRCLWTHTEKSITRTIGKEMWENVNLKIVLTVPAIWDYAAQEQTREAAKMAGLLDRKGTTLELVGEPEAAALSVFDELERQKRRSLKVGDPFVVCDAGGGTVDLISYTVEGMNPLQLDMCLEATGDLCGAIFVDAAFERHVRTMVKAEAYDRIKTRPRREMMNDWEFGVKRQFKVDSPHDARWHVRAPGLEGLDTHQPPSTMSMSDLSMLSDPGDLVLETDHLHAIFSETCSKIEDLVREQVMAVTKQEERPPRAILLVGGFGENEYLREYLERAFHSIEIQQPLKAWAAICRGAVMKGLGSDVVLNYISRYNYGTTFVEEFDEETHLPNDRDADKISAIPMAKNLMQWFIKKGESVALDRPVEHGFSVHVTSREQMTYSFNILFSETPRAEKRIGPNVKLLCKLIAAFDPKIYDELPKCKNEKGEECRDLGFTLEMRVTSGEICWSTKYKGIEMGLVKSIMGQEMENV